MIERQASSPVIERNGNGNGNGFYRRLEYSPILEHEKSKSLIEIVLDRTGKNLQELPPEVSKILILVDSQKDLKTGEPIPLDDKFTIAGYAFWEVGGSFALVKEYLGEYAGPKWESLLNRVWERNDLISKFDRVKREKIFLETMLGKNVANLKAEKVLEMYRGQIEYLRGKDKTYREIRESRDNILRHVSSIVKVPLQKRIIRKMEKGKSIEQIAYELFLDKSIVEEYAKSISIKKIPQEYRIENSQGTLLKGINYQEVYYQYGVDRNILRDLRRKFFEKGEINLDFLTGEHIKIKTFRDKGIGNLDIAKILDIPVYKVNEISGDLILAGLIDPLGWHSKFEAAKFRKACDLIVDLDMEGKSGLEIANKLNWTTERVSDSKRRLRRTGEISSLRQNEIFEGEFKKFLQKLEKIEDESLTDFEIAKIMNEKEHRVRRGRRRLRKMGKAKIKRPEDSRRYYSQRLKRERLVKSS